MVVPLVIKEKNSIRFSSLGQKCCEIMSAINLSIAMACSKKGALILAARLYCASIRLASSLFLSTNFIYYPNKLYLRLIETTREKRPSKPLLKRTTTVSPSPPPSPVTPLVLKCCRLSAGSSP